MCGIFSYRGEQCPVKKCLEGLERLAYRGYDSSGIAGFGEGVVRICRQVGKLERLKEALQGHDWQVESAVAHTRWATHGKPTEHNAHPHFDQQGRVAVVHNGIVENHHRLRNELMAQGVHFSSETDTEVIAQLIGTLYQGDLRVACQQVVQRLEGSFAIVVIHKDNPKVMVGAVRNCPLMVARNKKEVMIASDLAAFVGEQLEVFFLQDNEIAVIDRHTVSLWDALGKAIRRPWKPLPVSSEASCKQGFEHFMLKEIYEQPKTLSATLERRLHPEALYQELPAGLIQYIKKDVTQVALVACGTSYHASRIAANLLQETAHLPAQAHIASEFRSQLPIVTPSTLVIAVSQSGETADTLGAVREAKLRGATVIALCNVEHALLTRFADLTLPLRAGPEISVCSTKAFTSQLALLTLLSIWIARIRLDSPQMMQSMIEELAQMPGHLAAILQQNAFLERLAQKYAKYDHFFYVGRSYMHSTSLEAALKLKEIAYIDANGYPAGEMKHGPIALLTSEFPVMAFCANQQTIDKMLSNLMEIRARSAPIIALAFYGCHQIDKIVDDLFWLPQSSDALAPLTACIAAQLFAYHVAKIRGTDIDQPRNLAKSVTVE